MSKATLQQLQKKWYKKLKDSGFNDIEDVNSKKQWLKRWDDYYFRRRFNKTTFEARECYFQAAVDMLNTHKFSRLGRMIWKRHAEGMEVREIGRDLGIPKSTVMDIISTIRKELLNADKVKKP